LEGLRHVGSPQCVIGVLLDDISAGAAVLDSVLMEGCRVAADAKVSGSVMGPRAIVGQRGDVRPVSVLGADAVVSSGTLVDGERVSG